MLDDVLGLYGPNFELTLEGYFTHLESVRVMADISRTRHPKCTDARLGAMRRRLLDALSAVLEESADVSKKTSEAVKRPCSFHDAIVGRLQRKDTIVVPTPWGNAELALRRAAVIAFVGFSFTPTDLHVAALFRIALVGTGQLRVLAEVEDLDVRLVVTGARRAGSEAGA